MTQTHTHGAINQIEVYSSDPMQQQFDFYRTALKTRVMQSLTATSTSLHAVKDELIMQHSHEQAIIEQAYHSVQNELIQPAVFDE